MRHWMPWPTRHAWAFFLTSLVLVAQPVRAQTKPASLLDFSATEVQKIAAHGPWPPAAAQDAGNAQSGNRWAIALGQQLFFDASLSTDQLMACASCHPPGLAFADGLKRSVGREVLDRNTPSLWNSVHARWQGWDGAADSLWSQAIRPLLDSREMAGSAQHVAKAIASKPDLLCRYQQVFKHPPQNDPETTLVNAAKALGAFTATLVSGTTAFDRFRDALAAGQLRQAARYPMAAQRGLRTFIGKGQCNLCHLGPLFSNGEFADIGMPFFIRPGVVDAGRHGGIVALQASPYNLLGRWRDAGQAASSIKTRQVDLQHRNFGEFKVPSLRNVALTAPYMHDGQLATLRDVLRHYSNLNLERLHADGEQILKPLNLTDAEMSDMLVFLNSLSDPAAKHWKPLALAPCKPQTLLK
jgi:cytochrome c peroxidase